MNEIPEENIKNCLPYFFGKNRCQEVRQMKHCQAVGVDLLLHPVEVQSRPDGASELNSSIVDQDNG